MLERDWVRDWELCENAISPPWRYGLYLGGANYIDAVYPNGDIRFGRLADVYHEPTAKFIVEAREALPYWLNRVQELEEESKKHHSNWLKALQEVTERNVEITLLENELKQLREENRRFKAVAEVAQEYITVACDPNQSDCYESIVFGRLRKALAALEEEKD